MDESELFQTAQYLSTKCLAYSTYMQGNFTPLFYDCNVKNIQMTKQNNFPNFLSLLCSVDIYQFLICKLPSLWCHIAWWVTEKSLIITRQSNYVFRNITYGVCGMLTQAYNNMHAWFMSLMYNILATIFRS
jgi:hypothetical protein